MRSNVEIKARVHDMAELERRARELADGDPLELDQEDLFFLAPAGRLKLRSFAGGGGELIYYRRPDGPGPTPSRYALASIADPGPLGEVLAAALGSGGVVRKSRKVYLAGQTRIHLDRVEGLGDFMELEVVLRPGQAEAEGERIAAELMERLGIAGGDLLSGAYVDMLAGAAAGEGPGDPPAPGPAGRVPR
jgi:adenylate cyclase class IV